MKRQLGKSGIDVSAIGMGCWAIGGPFTGYGAQIGWGEVDDAESITALRAAYEHGITFFDTSDAYGTGHSEKIIGKAFANMRDKVVIATKFGNVIDRPNRALVGQQADEAYVREACEASLQRLQTDYIDLYQFHLGDYPAEEAPAVMAVLETLVSQGKIRSYAWSTDNAANAAVFAEGAHCAAVQHRLNLFEDAPDIIALCEAHNLASVNRSPLAMGLLSGKYSAQSDFAANDIRATPDLGWMAYFKNGKPNPELLKRLEGIRDILTSNGRSLVQGSLAWLLARSPQTIPIPGIRTVVQAVENAGAMALGPLRPQQMAEIEALLRPETAIKNGRLTHS
ncbi:MAG: aldo/keto reductase [Chloroflexota bacterium]